MTWVRTQAVLLRAGDPQHGGRRYGRHSAGRPVHGSRGSRVTRAEAFAIIDAERARQAVKWSGPHAWGAGDCSSPAVPTVVRVAVLTEECGEVARAVLDQDRDGLRAELVQVAAVAVAWLESM